MTLTVSDLYYITCDDNVADKPAAEAKLRKAMDWLISSEGECIGETLLKAAYMRHGRPLKIRILDPNAPAPIPRLESQATNNTGYIDSSHELQLNLDDIETVQLPNADGTLSPLPLECVLAHEMFHAGQREDPALFRAQAASEEEIMRELRSSRRNMRLRMGELKQQIYQAPDYRSAMELAKEHVECNIEQEDIIAKLALRYPDIARYEEEVELPAIAIEQRVARLLGAPARTCHNPLDGFSREQQKDIWMGILVHDLKIDQKPGAPANHIHATPELRRDGPVNIKAPDQSWTVG